MHQLREDNIVFAFDNLPCKGSPAFALREISSMDHKVMSMLLEVLLRDNAVIREDEDRLNHWWNILMAHKQMALQLSC